MGFVDSVVVVVSFWLVVLLLVGLGAFCEQAVHDYLEWRKKGR